ncbi:AMP-binding protein, partial [Agrococcus terreus]
MQEIIIPPVAEAPHDSNATDLVENQYRQDPHHPLFARQLQPGQWTDVSAREFREDAKTIARGLASVGIEPGDSVAIMSPTRYEWTLIDLAIMYAGAVTVPIYETSSPSQIAWIVRDSQVKAAIVETSGHARS